MAKITAHVTGRRRDWAEKVSARLIADHDVIVFEALDIDDMVRRPKPRPDPQRTGGFLPNRATAKAGLNRGILASHSAGTTLPASRASRMGSARRREPPIGAG